MLSAASAPYHALPGWRRAFVPGRLTLGLFFPIEGYFRDRPTMRDQETLARRAEELGFAALWVRDVPLRDPSFGDLGQVYDPWTYLGWMAAHTSAIALGTAAIALPLRHPLHEAKAAASIDRLSGGRLLLGVASGDRPVEFPAFGRDPAARAGELREAVALMKRAWGAETFGRADVVPKPSAREVPLLVAGHAGQTVEWIAANAHGWFTYPRPAAEQAALIASWRAAAAAAAPEEPRPFSQALYLDLHANPDLPAWPLQLGIRAGRHTVLRHLAALAAAGVAHVALNLKPSHRPAAEVIEELGEHVLPALSSAP